VYWKLLKIYVNRKIIEAKHSHWMPQTFAEH